MSTCQIEDHDYDGAVRLGRAHWICPICEQDITFELALYTEALAETKDKMEPDYARIHDQHAG